MAPPYVPSNNLINVPFRGLKMGHFWDIYAHLTPPDPTLQSPLPMTDPYIQNLFVDRIGGAQYGKSTEIYKFEKIKRAKRAALAAHPGVELIDMGVGEPDA